MNQQELLVIANCIIGEMDDSLGKDFSPINMVNAEDAMLNRQLNTASVKHAIDLPLITMENTPKYFKRLDVLKVVKRLRAQRNWRVVKLAWIRQHISVGPLDEVEMIQQVSSVARKLTAFKQGACGELAMFAYNIALRKPGTHPQILKAPGTNDWHALLLLGVEEEFRKPSKLSAIADNYPEAVIVDYWAVYGGTRHNGAFPIGDYINDTETVLKGYDLGKVVTWNHGGERAEVVELREAVQYFNTEGRQF
jgi:hypothetical protein